MKRIALFTMIILLAACSIATAADPAQHGTMKMPRAELGASAAFAPDGALYAVTKQGEHVRLHRSADAGASWDAPLVVNAQPEAISADGENRPKLAFAADGTMLVSWTHPLSKRFSGEIRLARRLEDGRFSAPITVHSDRSEITHRFDSLLVGGDGRIYVTWIDKRDLEAATAANTPYRGAAVYAAVSEDGGASFKPEVKVADHACECCRIAMARDRDGAALVFWRQVFEPNERDHALVRLGPDGRPVSFARATFDRWKIDSCPHHGPSLAVTPDGTRHAVWFDQVDGEGYVFYGRLADGQVEGQRPLGGGLAAHADIAAAWGRVAVLWKEFDGERTQLRGEVSDDGGKTFRAFALASAAGASDQPRLLARGEELFAFWHTEREGLRVFPIP